MVRFRFSKGTGLFGVLRLQAEGFRLEVLQAKGFMFGG